MNTNRLVCHALGHIYLLEAGNHGTIQGAIRFHRTGEAVVFQGFRRDFEEALLGIAFLLVQSS